MADKNDQNDNLGNSIKLTGRVVNKRFTVTTTGKHVLNLFVRTKTHRNFFFGIGVTLWGDAVKQLNTQIDAMTGGLDDGETIKEDDAPVVTVEGELTQSVWEDAKTKKPRSRYFINAFTVVLED